MAFEDFLRFWRSFSLFFVFYCLALTCGVDKLGLVIPWKADVSVFNVPGMAGFVSVGTLALWPHLQDWKWRWMVLALSPPCTFIMGVAARVERFRWLGLLGLLFGFAGVVLIVAPGASAAEPIAWQWFLLALLAPVMFAGSNIAAALLQPPASSSLATAAGVLLGSALVLLPVMLLAGQVWVPTRLDQAAIGTLLAVAINAAFLVLFLEIIRRAGPVFFAQFNYLAVLAGVAWGAAIFGERLSIYVIAAMVLLINFAVDLCYLALNPRLRVR